MNIHLPVIWGSLGYQGFDPSPYLYLGSSQVTTVMLETSTSNQPLFQISIEHHQSTNQINQISQQPVSYPAGCAAVCWCFVVGWYNFHYGALSGSDYPFCSAEISEMTDTMGGFPCTKWTVLHCQVDGVG